MAFRPQFYSDIIDFIDVKLAALHAHTLQVQKYGEQWLEGVRARAKHRGY